jgi:hypothetical protein
MHTIGSYFMSADEELAAKGRLLTDYADAKQKVALLKREAERVADMFTKLGMVLKDQPEGISVKGQTMATTHARRVDIAEDWPDSARLSSLLNDLRDAIDRLQELEHKMRDVGAI